jgi:hypothetical protein
MCGSIFVEMRACTAQDRHQPQSIRKACYRLSSRLTLWHMPYAIRLVAGGEVCVIKKQLFVFKKNPKSVLLNVCNFNVLSENSRHS